MAILPVAMTSAMTRLLSSMRETSAPLLRRVEPTKSASR